MARFYCMNSLFPRAGVALGLGLLLAGAGCNAEPTNTHSPSDRAEDVQDVAANDHAQSPSTDSVQRTPAGSYPERARVETIINSNQGKPKGDLVAERLVGYVIRDTAHTDVVYFATAGIPTNGSDAFLGVYEYNETTRQWSRLYKETLETGADGRVSVLKTVTLEGSKLYLVRETTLEAPGTTTSGSAAYTYDFALGKARIEPAVLP